MTSFDDIAWTVAERIHRFPYGGGRKLAQQTATDFHQDELLRLEVMEHLGMDTSEAGSVQMVRMAIQNQRE